MIAMTISRTFLPLAFCAILVSTPLRAQTLDRSQPPALGPTPSLKVPPIQKLKLSNGLPVLLMEKHQVPLVQIELLVRVGSIFDPPGKTGLASLTSAMMDEGAGKRSALELADAIDFLGADISTYSSYHTSGVSLHSPLSKLDSALLLFADVARKPDFPEEELERNRIERLTTLLQWHDEPRSIASVLFNRTLFSPNHPYGIPALGNDQSLRALTRSDLVDFHSRYFTPGNATLVVVGDVTADHILPRLEKLFGSWKGGAVRQPSFAEPQQVSVRQIFLVDKPGAAQSEIRIGRIGLQRSTEDYFPLLVMNTILGGSFSSRLNQNLREEHGYSYGAGSRFDFRLMPGPFVASAAVQTDVTDKSLTEFMKELNGILQPIPEEEISRARNYLALQYPGNFQTVSQVANQVAEMAVYGLADDYFNSYVQKVQSVSKEEIERVAKKYLDPEKVAIIVVGDKSRIEKGILDLNLAPTSVLTIEDVLGKRPVLGEK